MAALVAERLTLVLAVALVLLGAVMAWTAGNAVKRLVGVLIALCAALAAAVSLGATDVVLPGVAVALALLMLGAALVVRVQEAFGGVEFAEVNAADAQSDVKAPEA